MFLSKGIRNNADPSTIYRTVENVEHFFRDIAAEGSTNEISSEKLSPIAAAHRIYTNSIAVLPMMIRQKKGDTRIEPEHYLNPLLKLHSNQRMSAYLTRKTIMSQAFWHGKGCAYIGRDNTGRVTELLPLPTAGSQRYVDQNTGAVWHTFSVPADAPGGKLKTRKFQESELLIHYFETYDGYTGRGMLDMAKQAILSDRAAQKFNEKFYANGARVSGVIEVSGELDEDNRELVRKDFERTNSGMDNAYRVAVMDLGMKYTPLGITQKESQYIEGRTFSVEEISRFTGIPQYMLQSGKQSYQSNEQQQLDFITNTLTTPVTQIEQEWTWKLFRQREIEDGYYLKLNLAALLRGDNKSRAEFYEKMIGYGILNQDDSRALEDMSPLPDGLGQNFWMSKNYDMIRNIAAGPQSQTEE